MLSHRGAALLLLLLAPLLLQADMQALGRQRDGLVVGQQGRDPAEGQLADLASE